MVEVHVTKGLKQAIFAQEVYAALLRLGHDKTHMEELKVGFAVLEDSLATIYHAENRTHDEYGFATFWQKYEATAVLDLQKSSVQQVLEEQTDHSTCTAALGSLAVGSRLGVFDCYAALPSDRHPTCQSLYAAEGSRVERQPCDFS